MLIYVVLFGMILAGLILYLDRPGYEKVILIILGIVLTLFAGIRAIDVSRDGINYMFMFDRVNYYSDWWYSRQEPAAVYIPVTLKYLGLYSYLTVFMIFAILGVSFKLVAIRRYSALPILSVLIYYSNIYLLHEMTQIRAGVSSAILLLTLVDIYDRNYKMFFLKVGLASLFHISALVFLPFYFINTKKINRIMYYIILVIFIAIGAKGFNIFVLFPGFASINGKLQAYELLQNAMRTVNFFNANVILNIALVMILIKFSDKLLVINKYAVIIVKMLYFSIISLFLFSSVPVLAWRISEVFVSANFIAYSYLIYIIRPKWLVIILLVTTAFMILSLNLFRQGLMYPYHTLLG